jgi:hypothetical protein
MSNIYLKTKDTGYSLDRISELKEIKNYLKKKYGIDSSIVKRSYIE